MQSALEQAPPTSASIKTNQVVKAIAAKGAAAALLCFCHHMLQ